MRADRQTRTDMLIAILRTSPVRRVLNFYTSDSFDFVWGKEKLILTDL